MKRPSPSIALNYANCNLLERVFNQKLSNYLNRGITGVDQEGRKLDSEPIFGYICYVVIELKRGS